MRLSDAADPPHDFACGCFPRSAHRDAAGGSEGTRPAAWTPAWGRDGGTSWGRVTCWAPSEEAELDARLRQVLLTRWLPGQTSFIACGRRAHTGPRMCPACLKTQPCLSPLVSRVFSRFPLVTGSGSFVTHGFRFVFQRMRALHLPLRLLGR